MPPDAYDLLAHEYSDLFPLEPAKVAFLEKLIPPGTGPILDLGCATGDLGRALAQKGYTVVGLDLNAAMVQIARRREAARPSGAEFRVQDLRRLANLGRFGAVLCLGNTLVHLKDNEVATFLRAVRDHLGEGGTLVIQVLNYDKILDEKTVAFASLETARIRFHRRYEFLPEAVTFVVEVEDKKTASRRTETMTLHPLRRGRLEELLAEGGFAHVEVFSGFEGKPAGAEDFSQVFVAS
jgi:SAM-dependent methyltransferase